MTIKYNRYKKKTIRTFLYGVMVFGLSNVSSSVIGSEVTVKNVHEVADICMYSQRLLKDYVLVGLGVKYHNPAEDLTKSIKVVNSYLLDLKNSKLEGKLGENVKELEGFWKKIEPELIQKPNKEKLHGLHENINKFTYRCEEIAFELSKATKIEEGDNIVLISELGMEAQRLAAIYMMKVWGGQKIDVLDAEVDAISKEVNDIFSKLLKSKAKNITAEVKNRVKKLKKPFLMFEFMTKSKSGRFVPTLAENKATEIFEEVRSILKLDEQ